MSPRNALGLAAKPAPGLTPRAPARLPPFTSTRMLSTVTTPPPRPTATTAPTTQTPASKQHHPNLFHPRYYIQPPEGKKPRAPSTSFTTTTTIPTALPLSSLLKQAFYRRLLAMYPPQGKDTLWIGGPRLRWYDELLRAIFEAVVATAVLCLWMWVTGYEGKGAGGKGARGKEEGG